MLHQSNVLIFVHMTTGFSGQDGEDVFLGDVCLESNHNHDCAGELVQQNAEMYGEDGWFICINCGERESNCDCYYPDLEWETNPDIEYSIEFYDPDKHGDHFLINFPTAQKHEKGYYFVDWGNGKE